MKRTIIYIFYLFLFQISINCKEKDLSIEVLKPTLSNECLSGNCVDNQWYDSGNTKKYFAVITTENSMLKTKPDMNSSDLKRLRDLHYLTVLHMIPDSKITEKNQIKWAFVRDLYSTSKDGDGWVLKSNLGFQDNFAAMINSKYKIIKFPMGDGYYELFIHQDGSFIGDSIDTYPASKNRKETVTGTIYKYNNYLCIKFDTSGYSLPFFLNLKSEQVILE